MEVECSPSRFYQDVWPKCWAVKIPRFYIFEINIIICPTWLTLLDETYELMDLILMAVHSALDFQKLTGIELIDLIWMTNFL